MVRQIGPKAKSLTTLQAIYWKGSEQYVNIHQILQLGIGVKNIQDVGIHIFFRKEVFNGSYNFLLIIWKKAKCHKKRIFPGSGFNSLTGRSDLLLGPSLDIFYTLP